MAQGEQASSVAKLRAAQPTRKTIACSITPPCTQPRHCEIKRGSVLK